MSEWSKSLEEEYKNQIYAYTDDFGKRKSKKYNVVVVPDGTKEIFSGQFKNRDDINVAIIPKSVKKISGSAFEGCENLKEVYIQPEGLEEVGPRAFSRCISLQSVDFPNSVKKLDTTAFKYSSVESITTSEEIAEKFMKSQPEANNFNILATNPDGSYTVYNIKSSVFYKLSKVTYDNNGNKVRKDELVQGE